MSAESDDGEDDVIPPIDSVDDPATEQIPNRSGDDVYVRDETPILKFPNMWRIDRRHGARDVEQQEIDGLTDVGQVFLTADIDSIVISGANFEHVIDSAGQEQTTFVMSNLINRVRTNKKSRFKVRHMDGPKPSFMGRLNANSDYKAEWYPNIELCTATLNGMRGHLTLSVLDVSHLRSTNFFTTIQAAVVASAFSFARSRFNQFPEVVRLFNSDSSKLDKFCHSVEGLPKQFETKITATGEVSGRVEATTQLPSSEARLFLRAVFAALRRFANDTNSIVNHETSPAAVHTDAYHGCENLHLSIAEFQNTAQIIIKSGVLTFQMVGTKALLNNHPQVQLHASQKAEIATFYSGSVDLYHRIVKFFLRSNTIATSEGFIRLDTPSTGPWVAVVDPPGLAEGLDRHIDTRMDTGGLKIPRDTGSVTVYIDVAMEARAEDDNSALIINGPEAAWTLSQMESLERLLPGWSPDLPDTLSDVFDGRVDIPDDFDEVDFADEAQRQRFITLFRRVHGGDAVMDSTLVELEEVLNDFANNAMEPEDEIDRHAMVTSAVESCVDFTVVSDVIHKGIMNVWPKGMTGGLCGNVSGGDALLEVRTTNPGTSLEKWTLSSPVKRIAVGGAEHQEWVETSLRGGQFYVPNWRIMMSKRTRDHQRELPKFPAYIMALLREDGVSQLYDLTAIRLEAQKLWTHIRYLIKTIFRECNMKMEVRMELFFQYKDDHLCTDEGLEKIGNLLSSVRQVNHEHLAKYMYTQSEDCCGAIDKLLVDDAANFSSSLESDYRRLSECAKAALVYQAEHAVMLTDAHPYVGIMHKQALVGLSPMERIGVCTLPVEFRKHLRGSTIALTGLHHGVDPSLLKIGNGDALLPFSDTSGYLRRGAQVNSMFWLVNKQYVHAIQMSDSYYTFIALLQQYSCPQETGETSIDLQAYNFVNPPNGRGSEFRATFFGEIDYSYIANSLDNDRRDQLMIKISLLLDRLYDSLCHYLVSVKNRRLMGIIPTGAPTKLSEFPRTRDQFQQLYANRFTAHNLHSDHLVVGPLHSKINTVGK
jgi:hypothetical protein